MKAIFLLFLFYFPYTPVTCPLTHQNTGCSINLRYLTPYMKGYNHIAGGLTLTCTFASFSQVNILAKPEYIATTVFFSLLPDIDHTQSLLGKILRPLSSWIYKEFGHRTLTHSLPFYLVILTITAIAEHLFDTEGFTLVVGLSLLSHLIFDMCTRQGIPFFYPLSKKPCVLPGNPSLRLSNENIRHQAGFFLASACLFFFCLPLGFMTTFNKAFIDFDHVRREARKSPDILEIEYTQAGQLPGKGVLVDITDSKMILFAGGQFQELDKNTYPAGYLSPYRPQAPARAGKPFGYLGRQPPGLAPPTDPLRSYPIHYRNPLLRRISVAISQRGQA